MNSLYNTKTPAIENGKLVLVTPGQSREFIGIRSARQQLKTLEGKTDLRASSLERRNVLRKAVALWDAR